jgi:hypothetical protein
VIGGHPDVCCAALDHLQYGVQYPDDGAEFLIPPIVEPALAVKVAEEFVGAVNQVNDHDASGM